MSNQERDRSPAVAVALRGVSKRYGSHTIISNVDLTVREGDIMGLVGPNGAGKTTLIKIIAGFARPSAGSGHVLGHEIGPRQRPSPFVGLMPEKPAFVEHVSARRNLLLLASLRRVAARKDIDRALDAVGLDARDRRPVRAYSQGMRQRLALAQAIMERPRLLLLDEPSNGLDPVGIVDVRAIIRSVATDGAAVVLSSHLLSEVQAVCSAVILVEGRRVAPLLGQGHEPGAQSMVLVEVSTPADVSRVAAAPGVAVATMLGPCSALVRSDRPVPDLVRLLVEAGVDIERIGASTQTLEEMYLRELTEVL